MRRGWPGRLAVAAALTAATLMINRHQVASGGNIRHYGTRWSVEQAGDVWLVRDHQERRVAPFTERRVAESAAYLLITGKELASRYIWREEGSDAQHG